MPTLEGQGTIIDKTTKYPISALSRDRIECLLIAVQSFDIHGDIYYPLFQLDPVQPCVAD